VLTSCRKRLRRPKAIRAVTRKKNRLKRKVMTKRSKKKRKKKRYVLHIHAVINTTGD